jgi:formamidopyrimidine-DNA glycosylase
MLSTRLPATSRTENPSLTTTEESRLLRASRDAIGTALREGGVHALTIIPHRHPGGTCPRDHAPMRTAAVDGRTSWWCSAEQLLAPFSAETSHR